MRCALAERIDARLLERGPNLLEAAVLWAYTENVKQDFNQWRGGLHCFSKKKLYEIEQNFESTTLFRKKKTHHFF